MKKGKKVMLGAVIVLGILAVGLFIFIKLMAPPGEEWISYNNDQVIETIDAQLWGLDIDKIVAEKEDDIVEKSIQEIQSEVENGNLSYEELTAVCLYRIKTLDQNKRGYNSVISVNPNAMEEARRMDVERKEHPGADAGMYGIPVMLKDNINTAEMPTSAGAEAFADFYPAKDAELVKALKESGAIILGKNNLSEFANYVSSVMPAGYSGCKGQTINPFGPLKISASGSSSGSAVAVTANLVPVSIGTETDGSIIAPASANSVVGFKPSRGNISSEGIVPLIKKIDTAGVMAKSVKDTAIAYQAASGAALLPEFDRDALKGKKIGLIVYGYIDEALTEELKSRLEETGAAVDEVKLDEQDITIFGNISLSFKKDFEDYAKAYELPIDKLSGLLEYNEMDPKRRIKYGQDWLEEAAAIETADMEKIDESVEAADKALAMLFEENGLDGLAFINSSGSSAPAAAGYPELSIPFGSANGKAPVGATFVAKKGEDEKLLNMGYSFEFHVKGRMIPPK